MPVWRCRLDLHFFTERQSEHTPREGVADEEQKKSVKGVVAPRLVRLFDFAAATFALTSAGVVVFISTFMLAVEGIVPTSETPDKVEVGNLRSGGRIQELKSDQTTQPSPRLLEQGSSSGYELGSPASTDGSRR